MLNYPDPQLSKIKSAVKNHAGATLKNEYQNV